MSLRALVVDDTAVFRRIVSEALAGVAGVEVVGTASNGRLAMARIAELRPDLVTLDIEMPEMNGIEVLEAMDTAAYDRGRHHAQLAHRARRRADDSRARAGRIRFPDQARGRNSGGQSGTSARASCADDPRLSSAGARSGRS